MKRKLCNITIFGRRYDIHYKCVENGRTGWSKRYHLILPHTLWSVLSYNTISFKRTHPELSDLKPELYKIKDKLVKSFAGSSCIPYALPTGRVIYIRKYGVYMYRDWCFECYTTKMISRIWNWMYWRTKAKPEIVVPGGMYSIKILNDLNRRYVKIGCTTLDKKTVDTIYSIIQKLNSKT